MTRQRRTPEQVSAAARANVLKRWHPDQSAAAKPPSAPLPAIATLADYDRAVGTPRTWQDAKAREGVVAELLANDQRRLEAEVYRGRLITREQVAERDRAHTDLVLAALAGLPDVMAELVPPEARNDARRRGREMIVEIRRKIAEDARKS